MSIGSRSAMVWLTISHSSYPRRDLTDTSYLIVCFLETSRASRRVPRRSPPEL
jgi:hypothetical protein